MSRGILQADGTYCYTGANCKKHGSLTRIQKLSEQIDSLFGGTNNWRSPAKDLYTHIDKKYYLEDLEHAQTTLEETGLKQTLELPEWNPTALQNGLYEITLDNQTSLLVNPPSSWGVTSRRRITAWLVENGKTVSMLNFLISPDEESQKYWGEATVASVEVRQGEQGKGYALKTIRAVENKLIDQKLHSGGHYTPEGEKALRGKLPFNRQAIEEQKEAERSPFRRGIGIHFESMTFVKNWDEFWVD